MKRFFAVLDCESLSTCPPALQHLAIRAFCEQQGGEVSFYTCEDPLTLPHGVLRAQLPSIQADGLCFFTTQQFVGRDGFDFGFLNELMVKWCVGFARENVIITAKNYESLRPWLWREGMSKVLA